MPSRKSNVSTATNGAAEEGSPATSRAPRESMGMSVEDLSLPRTMISRLSKGVLPPNTQIQKDALSALSKSATVFVNYLASNAMENAIGAGKKTIQPQDVLIALRDTEFEFMIPRIEAELKKYNTVQCDKRNSYRRKVKADKAAAAGPTSSASATGAAGDGEGNDTLIATSPAPKDSSAAMTTAAGASSTPAAKSSSNGDSEPPAKKIRRDGDEDEEEDDEDEDVDMGPEDAAEDDEGEIDEDEEMEEEDEDDVEEDEDDEGDGEDDDENGHDNGVEAAEREGLLEDEEERIQRQIERDEALDEAGAESD